MHLRQSALATLLTTVVATNASAQAQHTYSTCKEFAVGDQVEQYRHWQYDERRYVSAPEAGMKGTRWKIVELPKLRKDPITGEPDLMIKVQLIRGEYRSTIAPSEEPLLRIGQDTIFFTSDRYLRAHRGTTLQFCDEFRKVRSSGQN